MRLDKYLAQMSTGTRTEVKKFIRSGRVSVNGDFVRKPDYQVGTDDKVFLDGRQIEYIQYEYFMLNKPAGYVSATQDSNDRTVVSLITDSQRKGLFPVGRLDRDTEGLLLITNDGMLAHNLLSPRKHVWKTYLVYVQGKVSEQEAALLESGIDIGEEKPTLPAKVTQREYDAKGNTWIRLMIQEGRYHQIKRMMSSLEKPVLYLKRLSMGALTLDEKLKPGEYRRLTQEEVDSLKVSS